jgi:hypothetical protein
MQYTFAFIALISTNPIVDLLFSATHLNRSEGMIWKQIPINKNISTRFREILSHDEEIQKDIEN